MPFKVGREVVGAISEHQVSPLHFLDLSAGEVFSWQSTGMLLAQDLWRQESQLRSLAQGALADEWRVAIAADSSHKNLLYRVQFFKKSGYN